MAMPDSQETPHYAPDTLNRLAVTSLVLGVLGLLLYLPAFAAVITARAATRQMNDFRRTDGLGANYARAGAFLGYLALIIWTGAFMMFIFFLR